MPWDNLKKGKHETSKGEANADEKTCNGEMAEIE